jgi:hypothetical protein
LKALNAPSKKNSHDSSSHHRLETVETNVKIFETGGNGVVSVMSDKGDHTNGNTQVDGSIGISTTPDCRSDYPETRDQH